jgi:ankyrin repeat protein
MSGSYPYKQINFIKESTTYWTNAELDGNSIKQFYEELVENEQNANASVQEQVATQQKAIEVIKLPPRDFFKSKTVKQIEAEYLKAAETNDVEVIQNYIESGFNINAVDAYKWSALMIAIYAINLEVVEILLHNKCDLTVQDSAGNNAIKLAFKKYDKRVIDLLLKYAVKTEKDDSKQHEPQTSVTTTTSAPQHCTHCNVAYDVHSNHMSSIVHLVNEYEKNPDFKCKILSYKLDETNKGFQMLIKNGWSANSGLGVNEDGRMNPVKAVQKLDRLGFGSQQSEKATKSVKFFQPLKPNESHVKSIKDIKKNNDKERRFERQMRRYFDS